MSPASTRRFRVRRAIERGDPRLGLVVGVLLAALSALAFVRRDWVGVAETLELKALDFAFQQRTPISESDQILLVDIDDVTLRELPWPIPREAYAQAILALDRLGARRIVPDVQFKTTIPRPGGFDEETGDYVLEPGDKALRFAIERSGRVTMAFSFDVENPLSPALRAAFLRIRAAFARKPSADADEVARLSGVPVTVFRDELERAREQSLVSLVAELMDRNPQQSFLDIRKALLPEYHASTQQRELKLLQYAYWMWRCAKTIDEKAAPAVAGGEQPRAVQTYGIFPPLFPFLEYAQAVGCVNAQADGDGVMRRPWTHVVHAGRSYAYLGIEAGSALARQGTRVRFGATGAEGPLAASTIPVERDGRFLVNWAGNRKEPRGTFHGHVPFLTFLEFYQKRYELMDRNVRIFVEAIPEDERKPLHVKYLELSHRLEAALKGMSRLGVEESRAAESKMDEIRGRLLEDLRSDIAEIEKELPKLAAKERLVKQMKDHRAKLAALVADLVQASEKEKELRARVEGKICWIGSSFTASGDLHATPLGAATPGVDILANVSNMMLTGQMLRRAPNWMNFLYLFAIGLLVSYYVTHMTATWSSVATAVTMTGAGGLFWWLFTGPAILVPGAGPVVTAILTFAGVTTYKELLTQRSKRKLQRELEKNTSPELVKIILERPEVLSEPRRITGTFFFSDVKSFTSISEKMHADILFPFINRYLDRQTVALKAHQAFVDKYIGDGIMALFGIPVPTPDHARNACLAALDCQAALRPLNAEFKLEGLPQIKARIGIHSGEVSAGNVGALDRSNYTVLGDNVNLAARLEGANKEYDTSVMISEATWALVTGKFVVRELDRIRVVGKKNAVRIFELIAVAGSELPMEPAFLDAYAEALAAFKDRRWAEAIPGFQKAMELKPGDAPSKTYIERAKVFQLMPPPADWEGVFDLTSK